MIDYNLISLFVMACGIVVPLWIQNHQGHKSLKKEFNAKIDIAVKRDAQERKKIYKKLCQLETFVKGRLK